MAEGPTLSSLDDGNTTAADDMRSILAEAGGVESSPVADTGTKPEAGSAYDAPDTGQKAADDRARDDHEYCGDCAHFLHLQVSNVRKTCEA